MLRSNRIKLAMAAIATVAVCGALLPATAAHATSASRVGCAYQAVAVDRPLYTVQLCTRDTQDSQANGMSRARFVWTGAGTRICTYSLVQDGQEYSDVVQVQHDQSNTAIIVGLPSGQYNYAVDCSGPVTGGTLTIGTLTGSVNNPKAVVVPFCSDHIYAVILINWSTTSKVYRTFKDGVLARTTAVAGSDTTNFGMQVNGSAQVTVKSEGRVLVDKTVCSA